MTRWMLVVAGTVVSRVRRKPMKVSALLRSMVCSLGSRADHLHLVCLLRWQQ